MQHPDDQEEGQRRQIGRREVARNRPCALLPQAKRPPSTGERSDVAAEANKVGRRCAVIFKTAETSSEFLYVSFKGPKLQKVQETAPRVPFGFRPVQDRHRPVELAHDGPDDGGARASSTRSPATTGRARPAPAVDRIAASLHGSLAYTGIGHGTDRAVILGLAGETPQTVDPDKADAHRRDDQAPTSGSRRPAIRPIASIRRPIWCSTRRRRCPATPTAWPSTPTMPPTGCCSSASTIRSAAASSSPTRSCSG